MRFDFFPGLGPHSVRSSPMQCLPLQVLPCQRLALGSHEGPQVSWFHFQQEEWRHLRRTSHDLSLGIQATAMSHAQNAHLRDGSPGGLLRGQLDSSSLVSPF